MKRLVIIGARAMGREVCTYAQDIGFDVKGFLDDKPDAIDGFKGYQPILGSVDNYEVKDNDIFIVALGEPKCKQHYVELIMKKGGEFTSLIHSTAYVGRNVKLGLGCVVCPHATLTSDIVIGNHVIVNVNSSISHDCNIGDYVTISPGCHVAGHCSIVNGAFLGVHSALIPDVTVGNGVFVAAGAVVVESVASGRVMGVPAKSK